MVYGLMKQHYQEPINVYIVTFLDYDGSIIAKENVFEGENAKDISGDFLNARDGYCFIGWDKSLSNIRSDTIITALYEKFDINYGDAVLNANWNICYADLQSALYDALSGETLILKKDITLSNPVNVVRPDITLDGNGFSISGNGIRIKSDSVRLKNVTIDTSQVSNAISPIMICSDASVMFEGTNTITACDNIAGIHVGMYTLNNGNIATASVEISAFDINSKLIVTGGRNAAAIGGSNFEGDTTGRISLRSGIYELNGGYHASAIGSGSCNSSGEIYICSMNKSIPLSVKAYGGRCGSAIGAGGIFDKNGLSVGDVHIENAYVYALAGYEAATIGSGYSSVPVISGKVLISGENTHMILRDYQSGSYFNNDVIISGGSFFNYKRNCVIDRICSGSAKKVTVPINLTSVHCNKLDAQDKITIDISDKTDGSSLDVSSYNKYIDRVLIEYDEFTGDENNISLTDSADNAGYFLEKSGNSIYLRKNAISQ